MNEKRGKNTIIDHKNYQVTNVFLHCNSLSSYRPITIPQLGNKCLFEGKAKCKGFYNSQVGEHSSRNNSRVDIDGIRGAAHISV